MRPTTARERRYARARKNTQNRAKKTSEIENAEEDRPRKYTTFISTSSHDYQNDVDNGTSGDLWSLLKDVTGFELLHLEALAESGRLALLLDGLNECSSVLQFTCKSEIRGFLRRYPRSRVLLTARAGRVSKEFDLPTFSILPLDKSQQERFLATYLGDEHRATEALDRLWHQPGGAVIASNPFVLRLLADALSQNEAGDTWSRAHLYRTYLAGWYKRESGKMHRNRRFEVPELRTIQDALALLAYRARVEGLVSFPMNFALAVLREHSLAKAEEFLLWTAQGLVLNVDEASNLVTFGHETIQEYFCAEYILNHPLNLRDASTRDRSVWLIPIALAFELGGANDEVFVQQALRIAPLLSAVFTSEAIGTKYAALYAEQEPWTRGVIECLFGGQPREDYEICGELDPEVPTQHLLSLLRSDVFWYSVGVSPYGATRLQRLVAMMCTQPEPWADLLPACCEGNPQLVDQLIDENRLALMCACGVKADNFHDCLVQLRQNVRLLARAVIHFYDRSFVRLQLLKQSLFDLVSANPDSLSNRQWSNLIRRGFLGFPGRYHFNSPQVNELLLRRPLLWPRLKQYRPDLLTLKAEEINTDLLIQKLPLWAIAFSVRQGLIPRGALSNETARMLLDRVTALANSRAVRMADLNDWTLTGLLSRKDIPRALVSECIAREGDSAILAALRAGFISEQDIERDTVMRILSTFGPQVLTKLRGLGALSQAPEECKQHWLRTLPSSELSQLKDQKVLSATDVSSEIRNVWLNERSVDELIKLFLAGLLEADHIATRNDIATAKSKLLLHLALVGALSPTQIPEELVERWLKKGKFDLLLTLLETGRALPNHVPEHVKAQLHKEEAFGVAVKLVKWGLVSPTEFLPENKARWASPSLPIYVRHRPSLKLV